MNNILLLEPNSEKIPHLVFLLRLADISCTVARSVEEAFNWLTANRLMVTRFDLVLLNSLQGVELEKKLLDEMTSSTEIPLVYVQREGAYLPQFKTKGIVVCHPDNLLSCLQECLTSTYGEPTKERIQ